MMTGEFVANLMSPARLMGSWYWLLGILLTLYIVAGVLYSIYFLFVRLTNPIYREGRVYKGWLRVSQPLADWIHRRRRARIRKNKIRKKQISEIRVPWQIQPALFLIAIGIFVLAITQMGSRPAQPLSVTCGSCKGEINPGPVITLPPPSAGLDWPFATFLCVLT